MKRSSFLHTAAGCAALVLVATVMLPLAAVSQQPGVFIPPPGPPVRIVSPANQAVFYAPVDVPIFTFTHAVSESEIQYSAMQFTNVEIYATNASASYDLGPATRLDETNNTPFPYFDYVKAMPVLPERFHEVWCLVWSNAPVGSYGLTAVAKGFRPIIATGPISATSAPVNIVISPSTIGANGPDIASIVATDPIAVAGTNMSWIWPAVTNGLPAWTNWPPSRWGYLTNWGPKPALFTVRRFGDASSNLTVNYKIGGTASNGVDYMALPGSTTIAAGAGYGLIPIVPLDNGSNNIVKTVILTLSSATNTPAYVIGFPPRAEALIYYRWPRLLPILGPGVPLPAGSVLADGTFHFNATGPEGAWFSVQNSTDLVNWTTVCTNQVVQGSVDFMDPNTTGSSVGFYQVVPLTNAPSQ